MRVALSRGQARVTQQLLNHPQIGATLEQVRGARMAQSVRMQVRSARAQRAIALHQRLNPPHAQPLASAREQQRLEVVDTGLGVAQLGPARQVRF